VTNGKCQRPIENRRLEITGDSKSEISHAAVAAHAIRQSQVDKNWQIIREDEGGFFSNTPVTAPRAGQIAMARALPNSFP
jgi:hypothetical protein